MSSSLWIDSTPAFCLGGLSIIVSFLFLWYWGTFRYPPYVYLSMILILISTMVQLFGVLPYDIELSLDGDKPAIVATVMNIVVRVCYWSGFMLAWFIMPFFVPPKLSTSIPQSYVSSRSPTPSAAHAFARRAPSMCTYMLYLCANAVRALSSSGVYIVPNSEHSDMYIACGCEWCCSPNPIR